MQVTKTRICLLVCLFLSQLANAALDYDVLKMPAAKSHLAAKSLIYSVETFGDRTFATGHRGHIVYSDDLGETWTQAEVPVRVGILDIFFATAEKGWAVGHGGVILHSSDGGKTWEQQYDGYRFGDEGLPFYQKKLKDFQDAAAANPEAEGSEAEGEMLEYLIGEMEYAIDQGADKPFFKVYFHNEKLGYAFGAYGIVVKTEDGGKTWVHAMHNVENDNFYHLFDYTPMTNGRFLLNGEAGQLFDASVEDDRATLLETTPYEGSFFTSVSAKDGSLVVGGLRGLAFVSHDFGETWAAVKKPPTGSVVDSMALDDGRVILVTMTGDVLVSTDSGDTFSRAKTPKVGPIFAVEDGGPGALLVAGPLGVMKIPFGQ